MEAEAKRPSSPGKPAARPSSPGKPAALARSSTRARLSSLRAEVLKDLKHTRQLLRSYNRLIINPRTAKWIQWWDAASFVALLFTATVTPIEVALLPTTALKNLSKHPGDLALFCCNRLVDLFFTVDLCFNFFMAYQEPTHRGGRWITRRSAIAAHYLRTWFTIDFVSVMPFDILTRLFSDDDVADLALLRAVRFVRLLRLLKLLRILRTSRILTRWQNFIGVSHAQMTMVRFMVTTFFLVHFMACTWAYVGLNWEPTPTSTLSWESSWLEHYGFVAPDAGSSSGGTNDIGARQANMLVGAHRLYFISLYVALCAMYGSVGSISPRNYAEYCTLSLMMFVGSAVWAWVIGSLCGILATLNPHGTAFRNLMDELNYFMRVNAFDGEHRVRLREFFRQTQDFNRLHACDNLMLKMSAQLRGDTALLIGTASLERIWFFWHSECEPQFLSLVALNLVHTVYEAREVMPTFDLTVIVRGVVARRLVMLTKGAVLGTDCVIPDKLAVRLRPLEAAFSLTFCQCSTISRSSLFRITEHFPQASKALHHAAAIYTLKGAFRLAWTYHKRELRRRGLLGAKVSAQEVHPGALQCSAGTAVLAALGGGLGGGGGGGGARGGDDDSWGRLANQGRHKRLGHLKHFTSKQKSSSTLASRLALHESSSSRHQDHEEEQRQQEPSFYRRRKAANEVERQRAGQQASTAFNQASTFIRRKLIKSQQSSGALLQPQQQQRQQQRQAPPPRALPARRRSVIETIAASDAPPPPPVTTSGSNSSGSNESRGRGDEGNRPEEEEDEEEDEDEENSAIDSDDDDFGDGEEIHRDIRRLRRAQQRSHTHVLSKVSALEKDVKAAVTSTDARLEQLTQAIRSLGEGLHASLIHPQGGQPSRTRAARSGAKGAAHHSSDEEAPLAEATRSRPASGQAEGTAARARRKQRQVVSRGTTASSSATRSLPVSEGLQA